MIVTSRQASMQVSRFAGWQVSRFNKNKNALRRNHHFMKGSHHVLTPFTVSKDEWDTKEDSGT